MPVLVEIRDLVTQLGFQPILASEFEMSKEMTHDHSLRLLYECRYAIFEVTSPAGQLIEIEKALSFSEIKVLIIYMSRDESRKLPSTMLNIPAPRTPPHGYLTFEEMRSTISSFLTLTPQTGK